MGVAWLGEIPEPKLQCPMNDQVSNPILIVNTIASDLGFGHFLVIGFWELEFCSEGQEAEHLGPALERLADSGGEEVT